MSDFDEEAERERLREQYERDKRQREATERMSDLLLKGATMTNAHCGTCGDPVFRYDGQEFCPTCQEPVGEVADDADQPGTDADGEPEPSAPGDTDAVEPTDATKDPEDDERRAVADDAPVDDQSTPVETEGSGVGAPASATPDAGDPEPTVAPDRPNDQADQSRTTPSTESTDVSAQSAVDAGSLADARASLTRTVTRLSRQAEASNDLEQTRAVLAAVEEAADALAAVKRADR